MSALGQKRTFRDVRAMSALSPIANVGRPFMSTRPRTQSVPDFVALVADGSRSPCHRLILFLLRQSETVTICFGIRRPVWWLLQCVKEELHMGILDDLLGNEQLQKQYKDFVKRYEQGDPSEGYSDQEVLKRYDEVSHAVPSDEYAKAAQEALGKLSPEERAEFLEMLQERAAARGVKLPGEVASDPKDLGKVLTDLHEKPGQLRDMLGPRGAPQQQGSSSNPIGDMLSSPMAKAVLAGIAA